MSVFPSDGISEVCRYFPECVIEAVRVVKNEQINNLCTFLRLYEHNVHGSVHLVYGTRFTFLC